METKIMAVGIGAILVMAVSQIANAALVNKGAHIVVSSGANLNLTGNSTTGQFINASSGANHGAVTLKGTMKVPGNWTNNTTSGNVFTATSDGTVSLNGASQTISGASSFPNLSKTVATSDTLTFNTGAANKTVIKGTLTLKGASGQPLLLRSSNPGTQWQIDPVGTRYLEYLDVMDSNNINGSVIDVRGKNCTDSGNNTNWLFQEGTIYTVTFAAGPNGSLVGQTNQVVLAGGNCTAVEAVADAGYAFVNWTGSATSTQNPLTVTNVQSDLNFTANFATAEYTVTFVANAGGSLTGNTSQNVQHGGDCTPVTANADEGYEFTEWTGTQGFSSTANPLTLTNVQKNMVITANFAKKKYTLNFIAGAGGSLTGQTTQEVEHGGSSSAVTATPNDGFHFVNWTADGFESTANPLIVQNVTEDKDYTANFEANPAGTFTVTFLALAGGSINGEANQVVAQGGDCTPVTAVPDQGYEFTGWTGDYTGNENPLTITGVQKNMVVSANFAQQTFTVTFAAGAGGSLIGQTTQIVSQGNDTTPVQAVPDNGYYFVGWSGDATGTINPLIIRNITRDITINADFAATPVGYFVVNFFSGENGSIQGEASQLIVPGGKCAPVSAIPAPGYQFLEWTGFATVADNPIIATDIQENRDYTANFTENPAGFYTVNFVVNGNGSINGQASQTVAQGTDCSIVIAVADPGYTFLGWTGDWQGADAILQITNVQKNMLITANFAIMDNNMTVGRYFMLLPNMITGYTGDQFVKNPALNMFYDYNVIPSKPKSDQKAGMKVLNSKKANNVISPKTPQYYADCEWSKAFYLIDLKSWDKAKTCKENLDAKYPDGITPPLRSKKLEVSVTDEAGTKFKNVQLQQEILVQVPFISKVTDSYGATITEASANQTIYIRGVFFGKNPPKVWLEYPVYDKDGKIKAIKALNLKVQKPYAFADYNGEKGKSCMDIQTAESKIAAIIPPKLPKSWDFTKPHNIVIDNKIGRATIEFGTKK